MHTKRERGNLHYLLASLRTECRKSLATPLDTRLCLDVTMMMNASIDVDRRAAAAPARIFCFHDNLSDIFKLGPIVSTYHPHEGR